MDGIVGSCQHLRRAGGGRDAVEDGVERFQPLRALELVVESLYQELRALGDELEVETFALADLSLDGCASTLRAVLSHAFAIVADPPTAEPRIADSALDSAVSISKSSPR